MAYKKSYSRSNKTGFTPFLPLLFLATTLPLQSLEKYLHSNETNKYFLAKLLKKRSNINANPIMDT